MSASRGPAGSNRARGTTTACRERASSSSTTTPRTTRTTSTRSGATPSGTSVSTSCASTTSRHTATRGSDERVGRSGEVLPQEVDRPLPGQPGRGLVVARRGVVVEAVLRAGIGEDLVAHVVGLERRLEGRDPGVDPVVVLGVVDEKRRLD